MFAAIVLACLPAPCARAAEPVFGSAYATIYDLTLPTWGKVGGQGIRLGSFLLLSTIGTSVTLDDNVFSGTKNGNRDDVYGDVNGEARLVSQWSRHRLEFSVGGEGNFYGAEGGENRGFFHAGAVGELEVQHDLSLTGYARYLRGSEDRGTGDSFLPFDHPIGYNAADAGLSVRKTFNRFWTTYGVGIHVEDYEDGKIRGVKFDQDFRDSRDYEVVTQFGYDVSVKTALYAESAYEWTDYGDRRFDGDGYRLLGGVRYEINQLLTADLAAGFLSHDYNSSTVGNVDSPTYRAQLFWKPTPLIDVTFVGQRELGVSSFAGDSSRLSTQAGIRVDYAFRENVRLTGLTSYEWINYDSLNREDQVLEVGAGAEYFFNPSWSVSVDVLHRGYDSAIPGLDYDRERVTVGSRLRY